MTGDRRGFTLMEMLVALGVFSTVVVIAADLFLSFQQISRKTQNLEELTRDGRFIMEQIARHVREDSIDFLAYESMPLTNPQTTLRLLTRDETSVQIGAGADLDCPVGIACAIIRQGTTTERISSSEIQVRAIQFYIAPTSNPLTFDADAGRFAADDQPRVTVLLSLARGDAERRIEYVQYDLQTTITSRNYER